MKKIFTSLFAVIVSLGAFAQGQAQLLTEDFNGTAIPTGWTQNTMATDGGWIAGSASALSSSFFTIPSTGSNIVATNDDQCNCNKTADWLITSPVDLTGYSSVHVSVKVYYLHLAYQGAQENAAFLYSTDNGTNWTTVQDITNGSLDWQDMYFDVSGAAGNNSVLFAFRYGDGGGWNYGMALDDFAVYVPYNYDLTATDIDLFPVQGLNNAPYTISGTIQNLGGQTVNSIDLNYQIDGSGTIYTTALTGLNLAPFDVYTFTHPTAWNPTAVGNYNLEAWASNLDGASDQNPANDKFLLALQVVPVTEQRQVLVEEFTSSTCPPCASFNAVFTPLLAANSPNTATGKVNVVKYQMDWPAPGSDPNYNQDGETRRAYYSVNGVPNPFMDAVDGASTQAEIDALYQIPALVELEGAWNYTGTTATVTVIVKPKANLTGDNRLRIAVIEEEILVSDFPGYPVTNGETEFSHVMRKMLPDADGISLGNLTMNNNTTHTETHTFTIGSVTQNSSNIWYSMNKLQVVAWVQDDVNNGVLQSASLPMGNIGLNEFTDIANTLRIYPNPAVTQATVLIDLKIDADVNITFTNAMGQQVMNTSFNMFAGTQTESFDVSNLAAGIYMMTVEIDGVSTTKRVSISR
jgi:hypothetical protein